MTFQSFNTTEEMFAAIQRGVEQAQARTTPRQSEITYGDHWMRLWDSGYGEAILIFGEIYTRKRLMDEERELGAEEDEIREEMLMMDGSYARGFRFGRAYSVVEPDGELGDTHVSDMVPISQEEFDEARGLRWIPDEIVKLPWFATAPRRIISSV